MLTNYIKEIYKIPLLTKEEEKLLCLKMNNGSRDEAIQELVTRNLRFVIFVAKRFKDCGMPLSDLIQEGNSGLIKAANKFDPDRNIRFISYAVWWVRHEIMEALVKNNRIVKFPINKFKKILFMHRHNEEVDDHYSEISLPNDNLFDNFIMKERKSSANYNISEEDYFFERTKKDSIVDFVNKTVISVRERKIIFDRFGINDNEEEKTLHEIHKEIGLSRERVRMLEKQAIKKLKMKRNLLKKSINL